MGSFSLFQWIIVGVIIFVLYKALSGGATPRKNAGAWNPGAPDRVQAPPLHCMTCGTDGWGTTRTHGSFAIEAILWLCFLVPGLIYSIWRLTTRREVCAACGSEAIVPYSTPAATGHRQQLQFAAGEKTA